MARKSATAASTEPTEPGQGGGRKYLKSDDLPSADDVLGIFGIEGKTYQFVSLMLCGQSDYILLRERLKSGRVEQAMVMPLLTVVYFVGERVSTPHRHTVAAFAAPKSRALSPTPSVAPSVTAAQEDSEPQKRGRGRPKGSGKAKSAATATTTTLPRKRGRPRKLAS